MIHAHQIEVMFTNIPAKLNSGVTGPTAAPVECSFGVTGPTSTPPKCSFGFTSSTSTATMVLIEIRSLSYPQV